MLGWYKGESWRVFPNIEITSCENEKEVEGIYIIFAFCKFVMDIYIKF